MESQPKQWWQQPEKHSRADPSFHFGEKFLHLAEGKYPEFLEKRCAFDFVVLTAQGDYIPAQTQRGEDFRATVVRDHFIGFASIARISFPLDIQLPNVFGFDGTRKPNVDEDRYDISIIKLTVLALRDDEERVLEAN